MCDDLGFPSEESILEESTMVKAGTLKERVDRLKKKLAAGGEKLDTVKARELHKRIKRAQRRRRNVVKMEARAKAKPAKAGEEKPEGSAPPAA
jgi:hypothetical protein